MNGREVDRVGAYIEQTVSGVRYMGCFMADECGGVFPTQLGLTSFGIINILPSYSPTSVMGHYVLLAHTGDTLVCFDSYGMDVGRYSPYIATYIRRCKSVGFRIISIRRRLQGAGSLVCGLYCLLMAYILARYGVGGIYSTLRRRFTRSYSANDRAVVLLSYSLFPLPGCVKTFCLRSNSTMSYESCRYTLCGDRRAGGLEVRSRPGLSLSGVVSLGPRTHPSEYHSHSTYPAWIGLMVRHLSVFDVVVILLHIYIL